MQNSENNESKIIENTRESFSTQHKSTLCVTFADIVFGYALVCFKLLRHRVLVLCAMFLLQSLCEYWHLGERVFHSSEP